jgi:uncharacterized protein (TIGR02453 family)
VGKKIARRSKTPSPSPLCEDGGGGFRKRSATSVGGQPFNGFPDDTLKFLRALAKNNDREWFKAEGDRYEQAVLEPSLAFIAAMQRPLAKISPLFCAVPKKVGGSLMRIHRDTRFANDKRPYKTNIGIQFRHAMGGDVHAPGFYLHIEPGQLFLGAGSWHPASGELALIRAGVDERPQQWRRAVGSKAFRGRYRLAGDVLKRPPRDYEADHPLVEDLKRKDFIGIAEYDEAAMYASDFVEYVAAAFQDARPLVRFLCESLRLPF